MRRLFGALAPSLAGAALLIPTAERYRIDAWGDDCARHPGPVATLPWAALYLVALALLTVGWVRMERLGLDLKRTFGAAALVHALALVAPPFLSLDPLCYAAVGRAMAAHHDPYAPLRSSLASGDRFLVLLPIGWQIAGSAYWALFNQVCRVVALLGGDALWLHLRIYQLIGAACVFGTALFTARAVEADAGEQAAGARAAAFVLFAPLTIIEGTVSAHNDALLGLSVALFTACAARGRELAGLAALAAGVLTKASGLLVLGMDAARLVFARSRRWLTPARASLLGAVGLAAAFGLFLFLRHRVAALSVASALVGSPDDSFEHCTRSFECLPRVALRFIWQKNTAAWLVGLGFRVAGGAWLVYASWRAARAKPLPWLAAGLFIYYLFLHGFMQAWYLLSLVPLVPHADARLRPAMRVFLVSALAYYAIRLPLSCVQGAAATGAKEVAEACVFLFPAVGVLLWRRRAD